MPETNTPENQPVTMSAAELKQLIEQTQHSSMVAIKAYIDEGDNIIESGFKKAIDAALETNDYEGMLETIKLMKDALDGDDAKAGLQAWLNAQETLKNLKAEAAKNTQDIKVVKQNIDSLTQQLQQAQTSLGQRITVEIEAVKKIINENNTSVNERIDGLEEKAAQEKIIQEETNANLAGKIDQQQISLNQTQEALQKEAKERAANDATTSKRVTANEKNVAAANARMGGLVTRAELVEISARSHEIVLDVFSRPNQE